MLGNLRQKDPWGLLTSQPSFLDELQPMRDSIWKRKQKAPEDVLFLTRVPVHAQIYMCNMHVCTHTDFGFLNESSIQMIQKYPPEDTACKHPSLTLVSGSPSCLSVVPPPSCHPHIHHSDQVGLSSWKFFLSLSWKHQQIWKPPSLHFTTVSEKARQ